ncbi:MAG: hypothetical protein HY898_30295 [Deltaproteobacteria bacterium]|nr:hypothetical protein [Deltaproteobacteria bacterium]
MPQPRLLADRYRFHRTLPEKSAQGVTWLALDEHTDRNVVASLLPFSRVATMRNALGFTHERLTALVDIVHDPSPEEIPGAPASTADSAVVVAEWIPGRTLSELLRAAPMPVFEAVQCVAKICGVLAGLHERGAVHGALSARALLVWRSDHGPLPLLTQLVAPPSGSCFSPERVAGGGPNAADDAWAVHAILYSALAGAPPFSGATRQELADSILACAPPPLGSLGVDDSDLAHLMTRGFAKKLAERRVDVDELLADLTLWLTRSTMRAKGVPETRPAFTGYYSLRDPKAPDAAPEPAVEVAILRQTGASDVQPQPATEQTEASADPVEVSKAPGNIRPEPPPDDSATAGAPANQGSAPEPSANQGSALEASANQGSAPEPSANEASAPAASVNHSPAPGAPARDPAAGTSPPRDNSLTPAFVAARPRKPAHLPIALLVGAGALLAGGILYKVASPAPGVDAVPSSGAAVPSTLASTTQASWTPAIPSSAGAVLPVGSETAVRAAPSASSVPALDVSACVASYFPADTFRVPQDLGFVCEEKEVRRGTARLRAAIVRGSRALLTSGMDEWGKLGWYELAVYGIVRWGCCHAEPVVEVPDSPSPCESLAAPIASLAKAVDARADVDLRVLGFEKAVLCVFNSYDIPRPYAYGYGPYSGSQNVFAKFLQRVPTRR